VALAVAATSPLSGQPSVISLLSCRRSFLTISSQEPTRGEQAGRQDIELISPPPRSPPGSAALLLLFPSPQRPAIPMTCYCYFPYAISSPASPPHGHYAYHPQFHPNFISNLR
jgi:hypothetical protein